MLESFGFNAQERLVWQADRNGHRTMISYDAMRPERVVRATDPGGRYLSFGYDSSGRLATVADSAGRSISFGYGTTFPEVPNRLTDAAGGKTTFSYAEDYHLTAVRSPNANADGSSSGTVIEVAYNDDQLASTCSARPIPWDIRPATPTMRAT